MDLFPALLPMLGALPFALLWWVARRRAAAERAGRDMLLDAIEVTPSHFALYGPDRQLLAFNRAYRELHSQLNERPDGKYTYDVLMREAVAKTHPAEEVEAELALRITRHESGNGESFDRLYPNGRWMRVAKQRLRNGAVAGFALDVTPLKAREAALEASEARYRVIVDDAPVGIWHLDAEGRTLFANTVLARLFDGEAPAELNRAGLVLPSATAPEHPFGFAPGRRTEVLLPGTVDAPRTLLVTASSWISDATGGRSALLTLLDITSLKRAQAQIEHLARHDPLTGLANRNAFRLSLQDMIEGAGGALILLDLDHFKDANDRHGHEAGDALLIAIGDRLRGAVRSTDSVCRLGGDEFALVVPGVDGAQAEELAQRAIHLAAEPVLFRGVQLRVGASVGIAMAHHDGDDADALNRAADLALYQSKAERRGCARRFDAGLREDADQRMHLREALVAALADNELRLVFQPQCDIATGTVIGVEALLRWRSSRLGRDVAPLELLDAAADARLLPALDDWVMDQAVSCLAAWTGYSAAPPILAINLSVISLRDPSVADKLSRLLLAARVDPSRLEIEVPECIAIEDIEKVRPTLERLNSLRVRLALDDFGAGLSSLQHVVSLPVQRLKLDRSIIAHLDGPAPPRAVLRATLALARAMGIEVMAEGVETEAQVFALRREGVTLVQGWLTGRPMERADLFIGSVSDAAPRLRAM